MMLDAVKDPYLMAVMTDSVYMLQEADDQTAATEHAFTEAMDDDFNTARAIAAIFDLVAEANRLTAAADFRPTRAAKAALSRARETLLRLTGVLGLELGSQAVGDELTPRLIEVLIAVRQMARDAKQYEIADAVRHRLRDIGIALEDRPEGTVWRRT